MAWTAAPAHQCLDRLSCLHRALGHSGIPTNDLRYLWLYDLCQWFLTLLAGCILRFWNGLILGLPQPLLEFQDTVSIWSVKWWPKARPSAAGFTFSFGASSISSFVLYRSCRWVDMDCNLEQNIFEWPIHSHLVVILEFVGNIIYNNKAYKDIIIRLGMYSKFTL